LKSFCISIDVPLEMVSCESLAQADALVPQAILLTLLLNFNRVPVAVPGWFVKPSITPVPVATRQWLPSFFLMSAFLTKLILNR